MGCFGGGPDKPQYKAAEYKELDLPELQSAFEKFLAQESNFDKLQGVLTSSAEKKLDALEKLMPGYKGSLTRTQQVAKSLAQGEMPADVAERISKSSAFKSLTAGLGNQQRQTVEARDMGTTSMALIGQGIGMQQALRQEAQTWMPLQAMNLAFTPQQIRQEDVSLAQYNNRIQNMQAEANANVYNRQQDANYAYDAQYGGSPWGSVGGGILGAGLGVLAAPYTGGMSIPMGLSLGSAIGSYGGGGQGFSMANTLGGVGAMGTQGFAMGARGGYQFPNFWQEAAKP